MLSQAFIDEMKKKLLAARQKLVADSKGMPAHTELGSDLDSQVQEIEGDEVSQDVQAAIKTDLEKIEKALAKIASGTYGTDDSGKEIPEARLKALPWADKAI